MPVQMVNLEGRLNVRILEIEVKGFRSLYSVTWKPDCLNVLIGPNASGKSNILRILELLAISAKGGLGNHIQREGGMEPLVWDGSAERIGVRVKTSPLEPTRDESRDSLTYCFDLARLGKSSAYRIDNELLGNFYRIDIGESPQPFKLLERSPYRAVVFDEQEHSLTAPEESLPDEETLLSLASGPFTANHFVSMYRSEIASWTIYEDLHTNRDAPIRQPIVTRSETRIEPDGQNLISVLHTLYQGSRDFKAEVDSAM